MERKSLFYYGIFFTGSLIALIWFVGGQALNLQSLAFDRENAAQAKNAENNTTTNTTSNKTARVVQGVLSAYREVANTNGSVDPSQIETVLKEKLGAALAQNVDPVAVTSITVADLHIVSDTSTNEMAYGRGTANLARAVYYAGLSQELDVFNNTFASTATEQEKKLGQEALLKASGAYKKLAVGLSKLSVPAREANQTVLLVNAYYLLSAGSDLLAQSFSDPVLSLQGIQAYARGYLMLKSLNQ